jgi:hypothetical protein
VDADEQDARSVGNGRVVTVGQDGRVLGAALGVAVVLFLYPDAAASADDVVVPHRG